MTGSTLSPLPRLRDCHDSTLPAILETKPREGEARCFHDLKRTLSITGKKSELMMLAGVGFAVADLLLGRGIWLGEFDGDGDLELEE